MKNIIRWGVIIVVILVPLLYTPWVLFPFMVGKAIFFHLAVELLLVLWLILAIRDPREAPKPTLLTMLYLLYAAWLILTSVLGINLERSFWSDPSRMTGMWTILHAVAFSILVEHLARDRGARFLFLKAIALSGIAVAVLAVLLQLYPPTQAFWGTFLVNKLFGTLGNTLLFAGYLVPTIFISLWFAFRETNRLRRWLWWGGTLVGIFALLYAGSRGGLVGMVAGGVVVLAALLFSKSGYQHKKQTMVALAAIVVAYVGMVYAARAHPGALPSPLEKLARFSSADITTNTRLLNWKIAFRAWKEHPVFGWGQENYRDAFDRHFDPALLRFSVYETVSDKPHNALIEILVTSGAAGLLLYLLLVVRYGWTMVRARARSGEDALLPVCLLAGMVAYLGSNFFVFDSPSTLMVFATLLGIGASMQPGDAVFVSVEKRPGERYALGAATLFFLALSPYGNITPLRPLYHATRAGEYSGRNAVRWYEEARLALAPGHPYHDEVRKIMVQDFISWATSGTFPSTYAPEALPLLRNAMGESVKRHPEYFTWHFLSSQLALAQAEENGDPEAMAVAQSALEAARAIAPRHQAVYLLAGRLALQQRDPAAAVAELQKAVSLAPEASEAHWFLAIALIANHQELEALKEFETSQTLGRSPNDTDEILLIADLYARGKQYDKLIPLFLQAVVMDPQHAGTWYARLAAVYGLLDDDVRARAYVREAVLRDPALGVEAQKFLDGLKTTNP